MHSIARTELIQTGKGEGTRADARAQGRVDVPVGLDHGVVRRMQEGLGPGDASERVTVAAVAARVCEAPLPLGAHGPRPPRLHQILLPAQPEALHAIELQDKGTVGELKQCFCGL